MDTLLSFHVYVAALIWIALLLLPFRPWSTRERLVAAEGESGANLSEITVLIPARDEEERIGETLRGLKRQAPELKIVLVDDGSTDDTRDEARAAGLPNLRIIDGAPLPPGWTGKLWAQEQGRRHIETPFVLLLDADILLKKGILPTLQRKILEEKLDFVSLMAQPSTKGFWERLLMPAFIYFFKLLYPFALSNAGSRFVAAAAGGCILTRTKILEAIGGFETLRDALIDDCTLARRVRSKGYRTWIGLSRDVLSRRPYGDLKEIWELVARTAYTQLLYSPTLLFLCTWLMLTMFAAPLAGLFSPVDRVALGSVVALVAMAATYLPVLRYYSRPLPAGLALPVIALLYLAMTWTSAIRYARGERSRWRGRSYEREPDRKRDGR